MVPCRILSSVQLALHKFRLHVKRVCGLAQGLGLILLNFSTPTPGSLKAVHDPESVPDSSGDRRRLLGPVPTVAQWVWDVGRIRGSQRRALKWIMLGKYHGRIFRNEFEDLGYSQGSLCDPSKHLWEICRTGKVKVPPKKISSTTLGSLGQLGDSWEAPLFGSFGGGKPYILSPTCRAA